MKNNFEPARVVSPINEFFPHVERIEKKFFKITNYFGSIATIIITIIIIFNAISSFNFTLLFSSSLPFFLSLFTKEEKKKFLLTR